MGGFGDLLVRPAEVGDAETMGQLHVAAWQAAYRGAMPDDFLDGLSAAARSDYWAQVLTMDDAPATTLVSELDGVVVAMASVGPHRGGKDDEPSGELWSLNAHPDAWGTGAATALHAEALAALANDHGAAVLWVVDVNARARRFYEREGWRPDSASKVESIGRADITEVRYRIELPASRAG